MRQYFIPNYNIHAGFLRLCNLSPSFTTDSLVIRNVSVLGHFRICFINNMEWSNLKRAKVIFMPLRVLLRISVKNKKHHCSWTMCHMCEVSSLMHSSTPDTSNTGTEAGSLLIIKTYSYEIFCSIELSKLNTSYFLLYFMHGF